MYAFMKHLSFMHREITQLKSCLFTADFIRYTDRLFRVSYFTTQNTSDLT